MTVIYIDNQFRCHVDNPGGYAQVKTDFFDGKCKEYIEGYMYIPKDQSFTTDSGIVLEGELISPWRNYSELELAQHQYENLMRDLDKAYTEGVNSV